MLTRMFVCVFAALAILSVGAQGGGRAAKPAPPPGRDPGGIAIALVGAGIDYTRPDVAARVARDGEGELIGWDAIDEDPRPFDAGVGLPPLVEPGMRLVVVRAQPDNPAGITRALVFLSRAPARIVVFMQPPAVDAAAVLDTTAPTLPQLLFVVPATDSPRYTARNIVTAAAWPPDGRATSRRTNADIIVAPAAALREAPGPAGAPPTTADEAALALAGALVCTPALLQSARSPQDARERLLATGRRTRGVAVPVIEACPARETQKR